jgi:hypothetical protein
MHLIITILFIIATVAIIMCKYGKELFRPFGANDYQKKTSDLNNRFDNNHQIMPYFKNGEVNIKENKYDEYLKKLYNEKLDEKISKYNTSCNCQKKDN